MKDIIICLHRMLVLRSFHTHEMKIHVASETVGDDDDREF